MIGKSAPPAAAPPQPAAQEDAAESNTLVRKRSVKISGHSTSLSLEGVFWDALKEIAGGRGLSLNALIEEIDRGRSGNLSSAVRVFLLQHYRAAAAQGRSLETPPSSGSAEQEPPRR
ncbi:ribbon-helix-helix domain-containing protein [Pelagibius sp. CAU 1746]|uniref:ribbon-helix-helix domain-containing protein n=1 Tax=Pelagibius sp. CAU 1746 TaxID=3140370 RepID=UPI00325B0C2B